ERRDDVLAIVDALDDLQPVGVLVHVDEGVLNALLAEELLRALAVAAPERAVHGDGGIGHCRRLLILTGCLKGIPTHPPHAVRYVSGVARTSDVGSFGRASRRDPNDASSKS